MGAFAEFKRSMVSQRPRARPKSRQGKDKSIIAWKSEFRANCGTARRILAVARECGVVQRIAREMAQAFDISAVA
jgi:hypothetical protein